MTTPDPRNPYRQLHLREAWRDQVRTNSPKPAEATAFYESVGWGEFTYPRPFVFGATFIEQPSISYGYAVDGNTLVDKRFPRSWGGVYRWQQDARGFWVGAHVFVVVDTLSPAILLDVPEEDPMYVLTHSFSFSAVAMKDLPEDLLEG